MFTRTVCKATRPDFKICPIGKKSIWGSIQSQGRRAYSDNRLTAEDLSKIKALLDQRDMTVRKLDDRSLSNADLAAIRDTINELRKAQRNENLNNALICGLCFLIAGFFIAINPKKKESNEEKTD